MWFSGDIVRRNKKSVSLRGYRVNEAEKDSYHNPFLKSSLKLEEDSWELQFWESNDVALIYLRDNNQSKTVQNIQILDIVTDLAWHICSLNAIHF